MKCKKRTTTQLGDFSSGASLGGKVSRYRDKQTECPHYRASCHECPVNHGNGLDAKLTTVLSCPHS
jgi:hypothetical protein